MIDRVFYSCVQLLQWLAELCGHLSCKRLDLLRSATHGTGHHVCHHSAATEQDPKSLAEDPINYRPPFRLPADTLVAVGYGKTQLKNTTNPFAAENRRVQIANTELK